jgi:hypothetical protein
MVGGFPVHNWCPYCGRPLAPNTLFCPYCGYQLGTYLGVAVTPAPPPMWSADPMTTPPYRAGRFPRPTQTLNQPAMDGMVSAPSAWDGRVHVLVDAHGRRWDGHQWVPNAQEDDKNAVADTPKPVKKQPPVIAQVILFLSLGLITFLVVMFFVNQPPNNPVPSGSVNTPNTAYYLHWSCGGSNQCAAVMGGPTGVQNVSYSSLSDCQAAQTQWANNNTMQPWDGAGGTWCHPSNDPTMKGP